MNHNTRDSYMCIKMFKTLFHKRFNIVNDFTPEEEAQVREENRVSRVLDSSLRRIGGVKMPRRAGERTDSRPLHVQPVELEKCLLFKRPPAVCSIKAHDCLSDGAQNART